MSTHFSIQSSDASLFEKATRIADEFARQYIREEIVGIVFLGAIARGYFDASADIDIALFKKQGADIPLDGQFIKVQGLELHIHLADYETELVDPWDMSKRWTYSQGQIHYDPSGRISRLLEEKVPLRPDEKKWLLMSGLCLSEWYVNRLTRLWVERGSLVSAHHMIDHGLNFFYEMLFALNDELVPDTKWRYYCLEKLKRLPVNFQERVKATMLLRDFTVEELDRRCKPFMDMWQEMLPVIEEQVHMSYEQINRLV